METINIKDLLANLKEITRCAVCLESVGSDVVQCMSGHGICGRCRRQIPLCPTCGEFFLGSKPTMLVQILEAIPKLCAFSDKGCKDISFTGNHELFCHYRMFSCIIGNLGECQWSGSVNVFQNHVKAHHYNFYTVYSSGSPLKLWFKDFKHPWHTRYYLHVVDDQLFLVFAHKDLVNKRFVQLVKHIPDGKPLHTYYFLLTFAKEHLIFKHTIKACSMVDKERLENNPHCMSVPIEELDVFINTDSGSLEITYEAIKKPLSSYSL